MISQTLARIAAQQSLMPVMTCLGLLIFVSFFVSMLFWTSRRGSASLYREMGQLPLNSEASANPNREASV